ncbi:hypothetical protein ig2599ANME_0832 [groundwater metagenome]
MLLVGCCGFPTSLEKYFQTLRLVEVQKTFYKPPMLSTATKWRESAPKNFEFTVKAWQLITHLPESPTYKKANLVIKRLRKQLIDIEIVKNECSGCV